MWVGQGQGQEVRGLKLGAWLLSSDCSGQARPGLFTEPGFLSIRSLTLQTLAFPRLDSVASSRS